MYPSLPSRYVAKSNQGHPYLILRTISKIMTPAMKKKKRMIGDVTLVCDAHVQAPGDNFTGQSTIDFLMKVAPPFNDTVWQCEWSNTGRDCSHLFTQIFTQEGICYTFNMLDKSDLLRGDPFPYLHAHGNKTTDWSLDGGYGINAPIDPYPNRAFSAGAKAGLTIKMRAQEQSDFYCRGPVQGFKVLLHNPAEIPLVRERYLRAPLNQDLVVVVQPNIMTTSPGLLSYDPHRRQCYFPSERYLKFFKVYTQRNCELECLTNYTLKNCDCVGFHMPRTNDTNFCGAGKKQCMITAEDNLRREEVAASYKGTTMTCDCLPACTSIQYNSENTQANFASANADKDEEDNMTRYTESRISIFFKEMQFTTSRRSELFGVVDFMAHCGGLLGLCCGMSFLSILELIYYITFRIWGNIKTKNKEEKKKKEEANKTPETADDPDVLNSDKRGIAYIDCKNK